MENKRQDKLVQCGKLPKKSTAVTERMTATVGETNLQKKSPLKT